MRASWILVVAFAATAVGCAPVILSVKVEPSPPIEQTAFVVKADITTTGASRWPTLAVRQSFPTVPQGFCPVAMDSDGGSGSDLKVKSTVPSAALSPSLAYGTTLDLTVSVPWNDILANTNYVTQTVSVTVTAPANCRAFDEAERTQGWTLTGFRHYQASPTRLFDVSGAPVAFAWDGSENYPGTFPHMGALSLTVPSALQAETWRSGDFWFSDQTGEWHAPSRAVKFALKAETVVTVQALVTVEYISSVPEYTNWRQWPGLSNVTAGTDGQWHEYQIALPQDFPPDRYNGVDITGRLGAVTLRVFGDPQELTSAVGKKVVLDNVCFTPN